MTDFPLAAAMTNLGLCAVAVLLLMLASWGTALTVRHGRHDGVDVVWGLGFAMIAVVTLVLSRGDGEAWRRWLIAALTVVWGVRLGWHIGRRNHGKPEDPRYGTILAAAPGNTAVFALRKIYVTQGAVMWLVSLPVQLGQYGRGDTSLGIEILTVLGVLVWVLGFGFESVGDAQLTAFRADPANKGTVLDRGLWHYTRHPNYFGDACVWWGLALLSFHHLPGLVSLVSASLMTFTLAKGTGAKLLESTIGDRRPGYADYVRRTSGFVPLPPKRTTSASPPNDRTPHTSAEEGYP